MLVRLKHRASAASLGRSIGLPKVARKDLSRSPQNGFGHRCATVENEPEA